MGIANKSKWMKILIFKIIILAVFFIYSFLIYRSYFTLTMTGEEIKNIYNSYRDGAAYVDETIGEYGIFTYGPGGILPKGRYELEIKYDTDSVYDNEYAVNRIEIMGGGGYRDLIYEKQTLNPAKNRIVQSIDARSDIRSFQIIIVYAGNGSLKINQIRLKFPFQTYMIIFFVILVGFVALDILVLLLERYNQQGASEERFVAAIVVLVTVCLCVVWFLQM